MFNLCFKAHYCAKYIQRTIDHYDTGVTPSKIYNINQLQAMRLADLAWHEVGITIIRNCWDKAGILPSMDSSVSAQPVIPISSLLHTPSHNQDPFVATENKLRYALDNLKATGILQGTNRMDLKALLNPAKEFRMMDNMTDEEICQAVLAAHNA
jgi:hypothetical protein